MNFAETYNKAGKVILADCTPRLLTFATLPANIRRPCSRTARSLWLDGFKVESFGKRLEPSEDCIFLSATLRARLHLLFGAAGKAAGRHRRFQDSVPSFWISYSGAALSICQDRMTEHGPGWAFSQQIFIFIGSH